MKCVEKTLYEMLLIKPEDVVQTPVGFLGFESLRQFKLLANADEAPFVWLESLADSKQAFLVMPPSLLYPTYQPEIGPDDAKCLGLKSNADAMVVNIVTLRPGGRATVNLKGPIVINRKTLVAKQVVPVNALHYNLQHPLPVVREENE